VKLLPRLLPVGLLLTLGAGGALVSTNAASSPSAPYVDFSHAEHLARQPEKSCTDCHAVTAKTGATPAYKEKSCAHCHDEVPRYEPRARGQQLAAAFSHGDHVGQGGSAYVDCVSCHALRPPRKEPMGRPTFTKPGKAECFACHQRVGGAVPQVTSCAACHGRDERRAKPKSHDVTWATRHGIHADPFHAFDHGQQCNLCHKENTCVGCHQSQTPRDHTALWRERGHGIAAAWDQTRCKTCHETNQCISCHSTNAPRNHRGSWTRTHGLVARGRGDTSCLTCHRPATCVSCHAGGAQ